MSDMRWLEKPDRTGVVLQRFVFGTLAETERDGGGRWIDVPVVREEIPEAKIEVTRRAFFQAMEFINIKGLSELSDAALAWDRLVALSTLGRPQ